MPEYLSLDVKQLLDEVGHDIMNYQNRGLCYLPKPKAEADNTDKRFCRGLRICKLDLTDTVIKLLIDY